MEQALNCERCGQDMNVEMRVASLATPGVFRTFFSCSCGHVDTAAGKRDNDDEAFVEKFPNSFIAWATKRQNGAAARSGASRRDHR